jgi:hypothetical protein
MNLRYTFSRNLIGWKGQFCNLGQGKSKGLQSRLFNRIIVKFLGTLYEKNCEDYEW